MAIDNEIFEGLSNFVNKSITYLSKNVNDEDIVSVNIEESQ